MTKTISNSRNFTLDSLLNTLKRFWDRLIPRNVRWREIRSESIAAQRVYKKNKKWDLGARRDWDIEHERITFSDGMVTVETLVGDLIIVLEENPFPGEQRTVLNVAVELFPDAKVMLEPKVFSSGAKLWVRIFEEGRVDYREKIYFPVKVGEIDIAETEELLWRMVREDNTILAADIPIALNLAPTGKAYTTIRAKLKERNWVWGARRESGKMVKIVTAPESR